MESLNYDWRVERKPVEQQRDNVAPSFQRSGTPRPADVPAAEWRTVVRDADRSPPIPDVNHIVERWDEVVAAMRGAGNSLAATALEHAAPVAVTATGEVTVALDEANPIYEQALSKDEKGVTRSLRTLFPGVQRVVIRAAAGSSVPPTRLTDEMVRLERLTAIRRKDPVLDRAIDALDLDLAD